MENYLEINYEHNMQILEEAIKYCYKNYSYDDIISVLSSENDIEKQLCLIELNQINSQFDADILVSNLTGKSGPIRETTSFKILDLISQIHYRKFFQTKEILLTFIKGIVDINPSVSRNVVNIIKFTEDKEFLYSNIIKEIENTLSNIDETAKNRSYIQNKKNFNLYWNLEALINIAQDTTPTAELIEILHKTALSNDYTIREKTAKTANIYSYKNKIFLEITELLKNDENIYVQKNLD